MSRRLLTHAVLFSALALHAQSTPAPATLTTGTQLVVIDVVVQDHDGHAVHDLKPSDFQVLENKAPQSIKTFDEHKAPLNSKPLPSLHLTPGMFTDYLPFPEDNTLNVLLLDTLNTPTNAQVYVRDQLKQYVNHAAPGARLAIFGLTNHLILLQGFTSDPDILKNVVDRKLLPRASALLDDPTGSNIDPTSLANTMSDLGASASAVAGMQQFEAQTASFQTQIRTRYTLDAFNQLSRYLATFPGRKNVIWFSGSFPITIFPDANLADPFSVQADFGAELRETTSLLDAARIAVYPIDARGLQTNPVFDASRSGAGYARNPGRAAADIGKFNTDNALEHMTMDQIADDTGGHAFYNTNGLADAVAKSIEAGGNYYTLTYSPTHERKGDYRTIHIALQGDTAPRDLKLSYRHGYYTDDPKNHTAPTPAAAAATPAFAFDKSAMQRGAPTPSEILFKVLVLPDSNNTDDQLAAHNQPDPDFPMRPPFRRYNVNFAVVPGDLTLTPQPNGSHKGALEFKAYVYDTDGKLLNIASDAMKISLKPESYALLMKSGLGFGFQVSAPAKSESFLRIAVHDLTSDHYGVVEVPTATVSHLPPSPPASPAPASK